MPSTTQNKPLQHDFDVEPIQFLPLTQEKPLFKFLFYRKTKSGVYTIKIGDCIYVGASKNIHKRWTDWVRLISQIKKIPKKFTKYLSGQHEIACKFAVVEKVDLRNGGGFELSKLERKWYNHFKATGYKMLNTIDLMEVGDQISWDEIQSLD